MNVNNSEIIISLYDDADKEKAFKIINIFPLQNSGNNYCCVQSVDDENIKLFLKYKDGDSSFSLSSIDSDEEYQKVEEEYQQYISDNAVAAFKKSLLQRNDYIRLKSPDGKPLDFLMHTTFTDSITGREYIAVQRVFDNGVIDNKIELMVLLYEGDTPMVEPVMDESEYLVAKELFTKFLEQKTI